MSDDPNQSEPNSPQLGPYETEVQQGRPYLWCACGHSQAQPFCDGAHRATSFLPLVHQAEKTEKVYFCVFFASVRKNRENDKKVYVYLSLIN